MSFGRFVLSLAAMSLICTSCAQGGSSSKVLAKVSPATVTIIVQTPGGPVQGTGFLIGNGYVITNYGMLKNATKATIKFPDGRSAKFLGLVDSNERENVALIRMDAVGRPALKLQGALPSVGSTVYAVGFHDWRYCTVTSGTVTKLKKGPFTRFTVTCKTSDWSTGCPVVNSRGEVLGMIGLYDKDHKHPNIALASSEIALLNKNLAVKPLGQQMAKSQPDINQIVHDLGKEPDLSDDDWQNSMDLTKAMVDVTDCSYGVCEQYVINLQPTGLTYGADPSLIVNEDLMKTDRSLLEGFTFENEELETARKAAVARMGRVIDDTDEMISLVASAQAAGSWSDDALKSSESLEEDALSIQHDEGIRAMIQDKAFQDMFPKYYLELMGVVPAASGYRMGILSTSADPLFVIWADPDQAAGKLQIHNLDRIVSIDGAKPKDMDDFKRMVKESEGRKVIIRVAPLFGDEHQYEVEVPSHLGN